MSTTTASSGASTRSIWERRPRLAAALFILVVAAVGVTLGNLVSERPHHRRTQWRVVTELPPPGSGLPGGPARGEMAPAYAASSYHNWVIVSVADRERKPLGHREIALVLPDTGIAVAHGVSAPDGGVVRIPVPPSVEPSYYRGELQAMILGAEGPRVTLPVPAPHNARSDLMFVVPREHRLKLKVTGLRVEENGLGRVFVHRPGLAPDPRSRGTRVIDGQVTIGGLTAGALNEFRLELPGREPSSFKLRIPKEEREFTTSLAAGPRLATARGRTKLAAAGELVHRIVLDHREGEKIIEGRTPIDEEGRFELLVPPGRAIRVVLESAAAPDRGLVFRRAHLQAGEQWDLGTVEFTPLPVAASGRVLDAVTKKPAAGALVVLLPEGGGDEARFPRTRCDDDGRFTIRAPFLLGSFRLRANLEEKSDLSDRLSPGATDCSLSLAPRGRVVGKVLCDAPRLSRELRVALTPSGAPYTERIASVRSSFAGGEASITIPAPPGRYDLWLDAPLAAPRKLESVQVAAEQETNAAALSALKIGEGWHAAEVTAVQQGRKIPGATIELSRQAGGPSLRLETGPFGRCLAPAPEGVPLLLRARGDEGYGESRVERLPASVELRSWSRVAVVVHRSPGLEKAWLLFELEPEDPEALGGSPFFAPTPELLGARQRALFPQVPQGRWKLVARRWDRDAERPGPAVPLGILNVEDSLITHGITFSDAQLRALRR